MNVFAGQWHASRPIVLGEDVESEGHAVQVKPPSTSVPKKFSSHPHDIMPTEPGPCVPELAGHSSQPCSPMKKFWEHWQLPDSVGW